MNARELYSKKGRAVGAFYCAKCRNVRKTRGDAEQCCRPTACERCGDTVQERYWLVCSSCRIVKEREKEAQRFEKAEKITPERSQGMVYSEDGDHYFEDINDLLDQISDEAIEPLDYVWSCTGTLITQPTVARIIDQFEDEAYSEWDPEFAGIKELEAALEKFREVNDKPGNYVWRPNYKVAVVLIKANAL